MSSYIQVMLSYIHVNWCRTKVEIGLKEVEIMSKLKSSWINVSVEVILM